MLKKIVCIMGAVAIFILAVGCSSEPQKPKLGVSFGVGGATRWVKNSLWKIVLKNSEQI